MKTTGIIVEYNPFHNGHKYQIDTLRGSGSDYVVAVMSGDFTQRGEPAIVDKYARARMALLGGADLVIELPVVYATADAKRFAEGGVSLLNSLGVIDELAFGVEEGSEELVLKLSEFLSDPPPLYEETLDSYLRKGYSYPLARQKALELFFDTTELTNLDGPNTILAIEYCRAIRKNHSAMIPRAVTRKGADYSATELDVDGMSSASALRLLLRETFDEELMLKHMPGSSVVTLKVSKLMYQNDFSSYLHYKLLHEESFADYLDITRSFSNRLVTQIKDYIDFESFIDAMKTKNITHTSVCRLLTHIMLDICGMPPVVVPYARVLGFRKSAEPLLSRIKRESRIPLITKLADADMHACLDIDIASANIYEAAVTDKYHTPMNNEFSRGIVIIE